MTQLDKALRFRALHERPGVFVFPNPWDGASARLLADRGFSALATSSAAAAATLGRHDGKLTRAEALEHCRVLAASVDVPVAGDLENGFGDSPEVVAETIRLAAAAGLVGGSIEDATSRDEDPLYEFDAAVARVRAAVEAARALPFPFTLTARAEGLIRGRPDLDEIIRRLRAFEAAGADVLFAPGLPDLEAVRRVCAAVKKPVNVMAGGAGRTWTVEQLGAAGAKRLSLAASLYRAAIQGFLGALDEVQRRGTFRYVDASLTTAELGRHLRA